MLTKDEKLFEYVDDRVRPLLLRLVSVETILTRISEAYPQLLDEEATLELSSLQKKPGGVHQPEKRPSPVCPRCSRVCPCTADPNGTAAERGVRRSSKGQPRLETLDTPMSLPEQLTGRADDGTVSPTHSHPGQRPRDRLLDCLPYLASNTSNVMDHTGISAPLNSTPASHLIPSGSQSTPSRLIPAGSQTPPLIRFSHSGPPFKPPNNAIQTPSRIGDSMARSSHNDSMARSSHVSDSMARSSHVSDSMARSSHVNDSMARSSHANYSMDRSSHVSDSMARSSHVSDSMARSSHVNDSMARSSHVSDSMARSSHVGDSMARSSRVLPSSSPSMLAQGYESASNGAGMRRSPLGMTFSPRNSDAGGSGGSIGMPIRRPITPLASAAGAGPSQARRGEEEELEALLAGGEKDEVEVGVREGAGRGERLPPELMMGTTANKQLMQFIRQNVISMKIESAGDSRFYKILFNILMKYPVLKNHMKIVRARTKKCVYNRVSRLRNKERKAMGYSGSFTPPGADPVGGSSNLQGTAGAPGYMDFGPGLGPEGGDEAGGGYDPSGLVVPGSGEHGMMGSTDDVMGSEFIGSSGAVRGGAGGEGTVLLSGEFDEDLVRQLTSNGGQSQGACPEVDIKDEANFS